MTDARVLALRIAAFALATGFPASGQSVVSTHSGLVYFFVGSVFLRNELLEQKFGRFPDIGQGSELRTAVGRAEVLLTPGVFLRLDENSAIRMLSTSFPDTRVELLAGSVILEVTEKVTDTSVKLIFKNWQIQIPQEGVCRIDSDPSRIRAYKGQVAVTVDGNTEPVTVHEGEVLPLAEVLVPDPFKAPGYDDFKDWAMNRSQANSADNTIAAGIIDDPSQTSSSGLALGGYSYFPVSGGPYLGVGNPYGLSFWSPFQSTLASTYFPPYSYGVLYSGWPSGGGRINPRWIGGGRINPRWIGMPSPVGTNPRRTAPPRVPPPVYHPAPHPIVHVGAHK